MLKASNLSCHYGDHAVLKDVSFELNKGNILSVLGMSGSGKTTLLELLSGLKELESGSIETGHHKIGYVFQSDALLPWLTVEKNLLLGAEVRGLEKPSEDSIKSYLTAFNLRDDVLQKYPSALSGGMRQRISIIQTLLADTDIILLDEPFSALDFSTKLRLEEEFYTFVKTHGKTALLVTHDIDSALALGDNVIVLGGQPSGIAAQFQVDRQSQTPKEIRTSSAFAEEFQQVWLTLNAQVEGQIHA